jgi:hypothetical protein
MKSSIFWYTTPCIPLKLNRRFGGHSLRLQVRMSRARYQRESWWQAEYVPPKRQLNLNGLHGVISQKIVLFLIIKVGNTQQKGSLSI